MARPSIVLSRDAESDLDALFEWIVIDSGVDRAEAILRRIDETLNLLVIVYEQSPGCIVVWRIIDGRRDLPRHIRG